MIVNDLNIAEDILDQEDGSTAVLINGINKAQDIEGVMNFLVSMGGEE